MDDKDKQEIAAAVAASIAANRKQESMEDVAIVKLELKLDQLRKEFDVLWKWKSDNEAVLLWARNFMDTYRRTVGAVIVSGAITLIGLLIQLYYTLNKK